MKVILLKVYREITNKISDFNLDSKWRLFIVTNNCCNMHEAMLKFCHLISSSVTNNEHAPAVITWREYFINDLLKSLQVSKVFCTIVFAERT